MRILVTGASGLLGLNFSLRASSAHKILGAFNNRFLKSDLFDSYKYDLLVKDAVPKLINETQPDWILHCAAIASIDQAKQDPQLTQILNADLPARFAKEAQNRDIQILHISSDAVFDGSSGNYREEDPTNPKSTYALSKLAGERAVADANPDALIARVVFYGWSLSGKRSLSEFFFNNLMAGKPINGFTNQQFCPLHVTHLTDLLIEMMSKNLKGLYHTVSSENLSKYDFGLRLANKFDLESNLIKAIDRKNSNRSNNLSLNTEKLTKALGHALPGIQPGIDLLHEQYLNGYKEKIMGLQASV